MGRRGRPRTRFGFPGERDFPRRPLKNVRNDNCDGEGLRLWCFVNNKRVEDDTNDKDVGEKGTKAADDGDDVGNGEEDRVDNDNGGGDDWRDVDVYNDGGGVASLFPCLPPIIVENNEDRKGGGGAPAEEEEERASSPELTKMTTT